MDNKGLLKIQVELGGGWPNFHNLPQSGTGDAGYFHVELVFSILFFLRKCFSVKNDSATTSVCCLKKTIMNSTGNGPSLLAKGK